LNSIRIVHRHNTSGTFTVLLFLAIFCVPQQQVKVDHTHLFCLDYELFLWPPSTTQRTQPASVDIVRLTVSLASDFTSQRTLSVSIMKTSCINEHRSSCKVPVFLILTKIGMYRQILVKISYVKFHKNASRGKCAVPSVHTDRHAEPNT